MKLFSEVIGKVLLHRLILNVFVNTLFRANCQERGSFIELLFFGIFHIVVESIHVYVYLEQKLRAF